VSRLEYEVALLGEEDLQLQCDGSGHIWLKEYLTNARHFLKHAFKLIPTGFHDMHWDTKLTGKEATETKKTAYSTSPRLECNEDVPDQDSARRHLKTIQTEFSLSEQSME